MALLVTAGSYLWSRELDLINKLALNREL